MVYDIGTALKEADEKSLKDFIEKNSKVWDNEWFKKELEHYWGEGDYKRALEKLCGEHTIVDYHKLNDYIQDKPLDIKMKAMECYDQINKLCDDFGRYIDELKEEFHDEAYSHHPIEGYDYDEKEFEATKNIINEIINLPPEEMNKISVNIKLDINRLADHDFGYRMENQDYRLGYFYNDYDYGSDKCKITYKDIDFEFIPYEGKDFLELLNRMQEEYPEKLNIVQEVLTEDYRRSEYQFSKDEKLDFIKGLDKCIKDEEREWHYNNVHDKDDR